MLVNGMDFWMSIKSPCTVGGSVFKWMNDNWQKVGILWLEASWISWMDEGNVNVMCLNKV